MGQEFLEDKQWSDNLEAHKDLLLYWAGLDTGDKQMLVHLRFARELLALRWRYSGLRGQPCRPRRYPGLRGQGSRAVHAQDDNRVLAFPRWVEGEGGDVMVVVHLSTFHRYDYRIGFPGGGAWREDFDRDVYRRWVNRGA